MLWIMYQRGANALVTQQPIWAAPDAPQFYDKKEYEPELDEVHEEMIFEEI